jgi:hypothetical protein
MTLTPKYYRGAKFGVVFSGLLKCCAEHCANLQEVVENLKAAYPKWGVRVHENRIRIFSRRSGRCHVEITST